LALVLPNVFGVIDIDWNFQNVSDPYADKAEAIENFKKWFWFPHLLFLVFCPIECRHLTWAILLIHTHTHTHIHTHARTPTHFYRDNRFLKKTGNEWDQRHSFRTRPSMYGWVELASTGAYLRPSHAYCHNTQYLYNLSYNTHTYMIFPMILIRVWFLLLVAQLLLAFRRLLILHDASQSPV